MQVRAADTRVGDFNVDVVVLPLLGLELAPGHVAVSRLGIVALPAFKLVVGHDDWNCVSVRIEI